VPVTVTVRAACLVCALWVGAALGAPRTVAQEFEWGIWADEVRKQHELAGSAYLLSPGGGSLYRPGTLKGSGPTLGPGIVLLGEVHDNPAHHQIRAFLIALSAKVRKDWRPGIVFEQINSDQQPALKQFEEARKRGQATADDLFRLLAWEQTGWPSAEIYKPLFEAALAADLPIYAGEPPRGRVRAVARGAPLAAEERERLGLDRPMSQALLDALAAELKDSHCGALPDAALGGLSLAQRYRDAHLADVVLAAAERHGSAILIAGNGHVRSDRGVPWYIRLRSPQTKVESWMVVETEEGKLDPTTYLPRHPDGKPATDMLIFTPRHDRPDPCAKMRDQFTPKSSEPPK
jgi:uncharacterized iron-regulated protein